MSLYLSSLTITYYHAILCVSSLHFLTLPMSVSVFSVLSFHILLSLLFISCTNHKIPLHIIFRIVLYSLSFVPSPSVNFFHIFCHSVSLSSDSIYRSSFFDLIHPLTLTDPHILSVCEIITLSLKRVFLDLWCQQKIFASSNIKC